MAVMFLHPDPGNDEPAAHRGSDPEYHWTARSGDRVDRADRQQPSRPLNQDLEELVAKRG